MVFPGISLSLGHVPGCLREATASATNVRSQRAQSDFTATSGFRHSEHVLFAEISGLKPGNRQCGPLRMALGAVP